MIITSRSTAETEAAAATMARRLKPGDFIALEGDLGAGKTQFVRGLAHGLGLRDEVSSPTFTLLQIYEDGGMPLHHFDLYRLADAEDVYASGLEEALFDPAAVVVVEWSERISELIPTAAWRVKIERRKELPPVMDGVLPEDRVERILTIQKGGDEAGAAAEDVLDHVAAANDGTEPTGERHDLS